MPEWLSLAIYVVGFLVTCRLLARHVFDTYRDGLLLVGFLALMWPLMAAVALVVAPFAFLVWLATLGVRRTPTEIEETHE